MGPNYWGLAQNGMKVCARYCKYGQHENPILPGEMIAAMSSLYDSNAITVYGPIVSSLLDKHYPKIEEVTDNLGISVRTFQRRLERDGLNYSQLVERIRLERACNLLKRGELKLSSVACSIGYSDPSSFSRAFKRWKGVRPSAYRRQRAGQRRGKV